MNITQHFVSNQNIPEFIKNDHSLFGTFIKAYYEWLELSNDSDNSNYLDVYKAVGNPGYLVNNQDKIVDVDETVDEFIEYFAKEVCPISIDEIQTDPKFFIKKLRDIYLAKGTPNSFKLFFKLYYNDNIEIFETRDTVLRASDGKYFAFPTAFFYISDLSINLDKIDFTLAEIQDSDGNLIGTVLEGSTAGRTNDNDIIIKTQFSGDLDLKQNTVYYIKNADDNYRIQVKALVSISEVTIREAGSLYDVNDPIYFESSEYGNRFIGSIRAVSTGNVEGIKVRNRGVFYTANDYLQFTIGERKESKIPINEVGNSGDVLKINNFPLKTGTSNTGYLAGTLEDVFVPVAGTGVWKELPDVEYTSTTNYNSDFGDPYLKSVSGGLGLQTIALSRSIGKANFVTIDQETFFKDSDDVVLNAPATIVIENNTLRNGDKIAFQYFGNHANYHPFRDDSESVKINFKLYRTFESGSTNSYIYKDSEIRTNVDITIPYGFDSETFEWKYKNVRIDTNFSNVWQNLENLLDSESNLNFRITKKTYDVDRIDGGIYPNPVVYQYVHQYETTQSGLTTNQPVYYFYHTYDSAGNEIVSTQNQDIYYSSTGSIRDFKISNIVTTSTGDNTLFDPIKTFVTANHGGTSAYLENLYVDTTIDGGISFIAGAIGDSEYDGGSYDADADGVLDGFDSFDISRSEVSALRITYNADFYGSFDSEIPNTQNATVYYSSTGSIDDLKSDLVEINSSYDSEIFKNVKNKLNDLHNGNITVTEVLYTPIEVDGGDTYSGGPYDSEYDGGSAYDSEGDSLLDSYKTFKATRSEISTMVVSYDDWVAESDYEGYQSFTIDSDDITERVDGGKFFGYAGTTVEEIEIEYEGEFLSTLDETHFNQLKTKTGLDSDILTFESSVDVGEPRILSTDQDSDVGEWIDTGHYGQVINVSANNKVAKVIPLTNSELPTQDIIDSYSSDKYNIIKVSKLREGVSNKDHTLPLDNVVHQVSRLQMEYKTSVVSKLYQKFYSQDGFLSSDYGGTIQDNYYYSDYSYRIKSKIPVQTWKEKFKTLLHPAGLVMTNDFALTTEVKNEVSTPSTQYSDDFKTNLTFDMQQEFIDLSLISKGVTTDGIYYKSNAFEGVNVIDGTATALNAASLTGISNLAYKQQSGNAWWDYEPIGLIRSNIDKDIDKLYTHLRDQYINWDSETLINKYTTQDSDGAGFVKNNYHYFQFFDGTKQDNFKTQSRVANKLVKDIMISKVQFDDGDITDYPIYDSELPNDLFADFNDSDENFRSIDYQRLKSDSDNRYFQIYKIPRTWDIALQKERDLSIAMKENGSLVWDDSDKVYTDFEAYERKWNQVNNKRTRNNEGFSIKGFNQYVGYENIEQRSNRRSKEFTTADQKKYSTSNSPRNASTFSTDSLVWNHSYYDQINKTVVDKDYENETYKDPKVSMRNRRGR